MAGLERGLAKLKQPKNLIFLLIGIFIILRLFIILTRTHPLLWDEAVYLAIGKYIYSSGTVGLNENFRPFLLPLLLGIIWKLGADTNIYVMASDMVLLLFSAGCIYLVYRIGQKYMNELSGLLSAAIFAFVPLFFYNSGRIMTEVPTIFFVLLAVLMFSKEKYGFAGLFCGVAFLFKFPSGIFAVAFALSIAAKYMKDRLLPKNLYRVVKFSLPFVLCIFVYLLVNYSAYGSFLEPLMLASEHQSTGLYSVPGIINNILYYPSQLLHQCLFFLFVIVAFAMLFIRPDIKKAILYFSFALPFLYFIYAGNKQDRFAMLYLPFLCLLSVYGFTKILEFAREKVRGTNKKDWLRRLLRFSAYGVLLISVYFMVFYDYQSLGSFPKENQAIMTEYNRFFSGYPKGTVILTSDPVPAAYSDARFIYFYDSLIAAMNRFRDNIDKVDYVVYNPDAIYCANDVCDDIKDYYLKRLNEKGTLIFNRTYDGEERLIYRI